MLSKHIILLSSGELRKFQLTKTLLSGPRVLIMDNPFIGLDARTRGLLHTLLGKLTEMTNLQIILVLSKTDDIPTFITHVIPVEDRHCGPKITLQEYLAHREPDPAHVLSDEKRQRILDLPYADNLFHTEHIVDLNKVSIRYGERVILKEFDWTVKCGEKWALSGENGAGKSTLLSLICADNPQSYACDISLFGRKRGSGESIWEIKKHIGYVSPEMHRAYLKNLPAIDIVASGLHDSIGLYRKTQEKDVDTCVWWMDIFGIADLKDRSFLQLSSGEQRMVLLARAFVKDPELKKAMFDRGMEVFKAIDEKADKTSNYAVVLQRKASLMNGYYGANVNEECAKTYQEALDAMAKDANMSEQLKNSIAYEANLYIATYAQVAENNMAKAKEHYEKAYTAKPNDQLRKFIDAQFK